MLGQTMEVSDDVDPGTSAYAIMPQLLVLVKEPCSSLLEEPSFYATSMKPTLAITAECLVK